MNKHEDFIANMEAARNDATDAYFNARPQLLRTRKEELLFDTGFEAAYKQQAETIERLKAAISNLDSMETPSDIKGRFQSELFWRGVYAARDALNKLEAGGL
tara:strand:- start:4018 stop:4323 length:306 start_codon:yes stop_codon:yes gene_type:complete